MVPETDLLVAVIAQDIACLSDGLVVPESRRIVDTSLKSLHKRCGTTGRVA
jgi:hypothetical protein